MCLTASRLRRVELTPQGVFYLVDKIDGYRRLFSVTDESLAHPFAQHERVPVWLLAVTCGVVPALVVILCG